MSKYYFEKEDSGYCWTRQYLIDKMKDLEISEMKAFEAIQVKANYFFCKHESAIGERGECGKCCINYIPRNGKSGICKHYGRLYEAGKEVTIKIKQI